jgi:hypothetical protein
MVGYICVQHDSEEAANAVVRSERGDVHRCRIADWSQAGVRPQGPSPAE